MEVSSLVNVVIDDTGYHFESVEELQWFVQRYGPLPDDTAIWVGEDIIR